MMANNGNNEGLFRAAMGDSPALNFMPDFDSDYTTTIFNQYATFA